jgi:hypothetical protein
MINRTAGGKTVENINTTAMPSKAGTVGQSMPAQTVSRMSGIEQVQRQVADLRQTLQELMLDDRHADGGIISASAVLDAQLEDYSRTITEKQPGLRTF